MGKLNTKCQNCGSFIIMEIDGQFTMKNGKVNGYPMICDPCWNVRNFTGVDRDMKIISLNLKNNIGM